MIYAIPQTEDAISDLQCALKEAKQVKWYRRLKIIQLSMSGLSVGQLSEQFDLCGATIRSYIKAYNAAGGNGVAATPLSAGIENLRPKKQPGRPKKVGHLSRDQWSFILNRTPNQYEDLETDARTWTLELLVRYVKAYIGEDVTLDTVSKALRRCKYRTGRSKLRVGSPDPDYVVKRERVETLCSKP